MQGARQLVALLVVALASAVSADDPTPLGSVKLPLNPYRNARVGDWATYVDKASDNWEKRTVTSADKDSVTVSYTRKLAKELTLNLGRRAVLSFLDLFPVREPAKFMTSDLKTEDEAITISGKTFQCKKVSFAWTKEESPLTSTLAIWLTAEVKGGGFARATIHMEKKKDAVIIDEEKHETSFVDACFEVAGFGSAGKTDWGETSEGIVKKLGASDPK
jgi:hypothetical protein